MNMTAAQIDAIVRQVLTHLQASGAAPTQSTMSVNPPSGEHHFTGRVLGNLELRDLPKNIQRVIVNVVR